MQVVDKSTLEAASTLHGLAEKRIMFQVRSTGDVFEFVSTSVSALQNWRMA